MKAEQTAAEEALARGIQLLVVVPTVTLGPMLQSTLNASVYLVLRYITGERKLHPNAVAAYTDVRDVSLAHILLYENPNASGRYLCIESVLHRSDFIKLLAEILPEFQITARCEDVINPKVKPYRFSNQKLKDIGLEFTPLRKCLQDMAKSLNEKGYFNLPKEIKLKSLIPSAL